MRWLSRRSKSLRARSLSCRRRLASSRVWLLRATSWLPRRFISWASGLLWWAKRSNRSTPTSCRQRTCSRKHSLSKSAWRSNCRTVELNYNKKRLSAQPWKNKNKFSSKNLRSNSNSSSSTQICRNLLMKWCSWKNCSSSWNRSETTSSTN